MKSCRHRLQSLVTPSTSTTLTSAANESLPCRNLLLCACKRNPSPASSSRLRVLPACFLDEERQTRRRPTIHSILLLSFAVCLEMKRFLVRFNPRQKDHKRWFPSPPLPSPHRYPFTMVGRFPSSFPFMRMCATVKEWDGEACSRREWAQ